MQKILLAIDGSEQSLATVEYAAGILSPEKTEISLYHVFSKIPEAYWDLERKSGYDLFMKKIKAYEKEHTFNINQTMEKARQKLVDSGFRENYVHVLIEERKNGIARDIISKSRDGHEVLILGRTGLSEVKDQTFGSVADKVIGVLSDMHICVVTGTPDRTKGIVALDGSVGARRAVDFLGSLINGQDFQVTLFHAMRRIGRSPNDSAYNHAMAELDRLLWEADKIMIEPFMEDAESRLLAAGVNPEKVLTKILTGVASRSGTLLEEAQYNHIGSIFIGRTGISRSVEFHIGRVTNKVIHRANNMAVWVVA